MRDMSGFDPEQHETGVEGGGVPVKQGPQPPEHPRVKNLSRKMRVSTPSCAQMARWSKVKSVPREGNQLADIASDILKFLNGNVASGCVIGG